MHERFAQVVRDAVGPQGMPGLVAAVAVGDDIHVEAHGHLAFGGSPVEADSLWRIASMTKPITGVATMALVDDGLIDLDEPVDRLLPELADRRVLVDPTGPLDRTVEADRPITTRDLLTFTFGLGMAVAMFMSPEPWPIVEAMTRLGTFGPPDPSGPPPPDSWIAGLGELPLIAQPGETWLYNHGASVLGVLLSRADGRPFPEVLRARVFDPLGMADTSFSTDETERLATAYQATPGGLVVWDEPGGRWSRPPTFPDGAGGLLSTAGDMVKLGRMFLSKGDPVISPAAVEAMTTPQTTPEQLKDAAPFIGGRAWGLCQAVETDGDRAGSFGWEGGLGTTWLVDPARDLVIAVLTQRLFDHAGVPELHAGIRDAVYAGL